MPYGGMSAMELASATSGEVTNNTKTLQRLCAKLGHEWIPLKVTNRFHDKFGEIYGHRCDLCGTVKHNK